MDIMSDFAERLQDLMIKQNCNCTQLAKLCNCPKTSISAWMTKQVYPKLNNLIKLSTYFDCSIDYILGLAETPIIQRQNFPTPFKNRFEFILKERHITKYRISKDCGFNNSQFTKWFIVGNFPQTKTVIQIAEYLNCSVEYLIGLSDKF
jgi:transcriptional regulator with XRE-family HTH domain